MYYIFNFKQNSRLIYRKLIVYRLFLLQIARATITATQNKTKSQVTFKLVGQ